MFYIQSKGRAAVVAKNISSALASKMPVAVCVERYERDDYKKAILQERVDLSGISFVTHKGVNQGLTYARRTALRHARSNGWGHVILADDDFRYPSNIQSMIAVLSKEGRPGIGVYRSLYQMYFQMKPNTGVHDIYNCLGMQVIAVDVDAMFDINAFTNRIPSHEDADMLLRVIRAGLGPWAIHSDCVAVSTGNRHAPGGQSSMEARTERERVAYEMLCAEFGAEFFSYTAKGIRTQWKKAYKKLGGMDV